MPVGATVGAAAGLGKGFLARNFVKGLGTMLPGLFDTGYSMFQQARTWDREDTAYSRAIKDMRSAGVNPQLYQGAAAPTGQPFRAASPVEKSMQMAQMQGALASIGKTKEESRYLREQARGQRLSNQVAQETLDSQIDEKRVDALIKRHTFDANSKIRELQITDKLTIKGNTYDASAWIRVYDATYKRLNTEMKRVANSLTQRMFAEIDTGQIRNPLEVEALIKAKVWEILQLEEEHFLLKTFSGAIGNVAGGLMRGIFSMGGM